jgi:hypothetical protein
LVQPTVGGTGDTNGGLLLKKNSRVAVVGVPSVRGPFVVVDSLATLLAAVSASLQSPRRREERAEQVDPSWKMVHQLRFGVGGLPLAPRRTRFGCLVASRDGLLDPNRERSSRKRLIFPTRSATDTKSWHPPGKLWSVVAAVQDDDNAGTHYSAATARASRQDKVSVRGLKQVSWRAFH